MSTVRIAIVGAGFAGLAAARQLGRLARSGAEVHLFDRHAFTTMLPALPDVAGGRILPERLCADIATLVSKALHVHAESVQAADLHHKLLTTDSGTFEYDYLLLANGAGADTRGLTQNQQQAHILSTIDDARQIRRNFTDYIQARSQPTAVVVGGGYTGLELAINLKLLAKQNGCDSRIVVLEMKDTILAGLPEKIRVYLEKQAKLQGIDVITGTRVELFDGTNVTLANGTRLDDVFFCWSTGTRRTAPKVIGDIEELPDGRLRVDDFLRLPCHPQVFVAGDAAAIMVHGAPLRKAVNFAYYSGQAAGRNILRAVAGQALRPFRPVDLGWVIPFGNTAAGQVFGISFLKGRLLLALHYAMCGYRHFSLRHRLYFAGAAVRSLLGRF